MIMFKKRLSRIDIEPGLSRSTCGGEAPTSFIWAHSRSAAGPSDTDLVQSKI